MTRLDGKSILVTGASRGIGAAMARALASAGATVGLGYKASEDAARALAQELEGEHPLVPLDLADSASVHAAVETFVETTGRIDGLVNNAAVNLPGLLISARDEQIQETLATNVAGPLYAIRAVLPHMLSQRSGVILNVSSVAAERPARGQAVYAASKGALESLTRAVAVEYARKGIRSHALRPGPIDTDMLAGTRVLAEREVLGRVPLKRLGSPQEVAAFACFLLSDEAAFVTGSVHTIDGGFLAG